MKKFLKINDGYYINTNYIIKIGDCDNIGVCVVLPMNAIETHVDHRHFIQDGRTLSDIMAEIEGGETVCKWKKHQLGSIIINPHYQDGEYICFDSNTLDLNPFCPVCGGKIEVQDE